MYQLLIPTHLSHLTSLIKQCLSAAEEQGMDTSAIEVGTSETTDVCIQVDNKCFRLSVSFDSPLDEAAAMSLLLQMNGSDEKSLLVTYGSESIVDNQIAIDANTGNINSDVFRIDGLIKSVPSVTTLKTLTDKEKHLSWLAASIVLDFPIEDAVILARVASQSDVSRETWPTVPSQFPLPLLEDRELGIKLGWDNSEPVSFPIMEADSLGLYPVVDDVVWIERLLKLGIKTIQLRIKDRHHPELAEQVQKAICLGREFKAQVFINDYWELAIEHGAYGIHLGQEDLEVADLKAISEAGIRLGLSTHGYYEIQRIQQLSPSYIALGHIHPTTTKVMPSKPQGLVRLKLYQDLIGDFPTVAIGGIDLNRASEVWQCGVSSLAVVRAITLSSDPKAVIAEFNQVMNEKRPSDVS
ncbi:Thiamine-phosphate synthase [Vibrio tapetis subsp. tapetis]|uniref:Thiamine-phosphate synthase n=2 Tax=Vibrio tapetis TaxID=52443 RepID=A0A2N8ZH24_9VIBR|nr:Thiamine-phosphate synthase [Vibrio tapetis subsp. tapetis]